MKRPPLKLCPKWPHCDCILQGYVNQYEINNCGRAPASTRAGRLAQRRADFIRVLGLARWRWHIKHNPREGNARYY